MRWVKILRAAAIPAALAIGLLTAACSSSPSAPCPGPFRDLEPGLTPPERIFYPSPRYTEEARLARIEGTVLVEGIVQCDGSFGDFRIIESLDPGLDRATLEALSRWRFRPATKDGQVVSAIYLVSVFFRVQ